jgi:hypothetical protein
MAGLTSAPQTRRTQVPQQRSRGSRRCRSRSAGEAQEQARRAPVVAIKPDRIILMDIEKAGERLVCVGERGFALLSDDAARAGRPCRRP